MKKKKELILFGGSFDPIHIGHVQAVKILRARFPDSLILVMPSQNRLKNKALIPIETRLETTNSVFRDFPMVKVVDWTIHWDTSSTLEVVNKIKSELYPDYRVSISTGEDILDSLPQWKHFEELKNLNWVFFKRHNGELIEKQKNNPQLKEIINNSLILEESPVDISSTALKKDIQLFEKNIPLVVQGVLKPYLFK